MLEVADVALPSFDDEALLWGDADPDATLARLAAAGVAEIVVKNGGGEIASFANGLRACTPTPLVSNIRDTTARATRSTPAISPRGIWG